MACFLPCSFSLILTRSLLHVCRQESIGCYWWTTMLLVSLWLSSPASCASVSCTFMVRREKEAVYQWKFSGNPVKQYMATASNSNLNSHPKSEGIFWILNLVSYWKHIILDNFLGMTISSPENKDGDRKWFVIQSKLTFFIIYICLSVLLTF